MDNPLKSTSIIVHLEIHKWNAKVSDRKALQAVSKEYHSDTQGDKYSRSLFVNDPLKDIDRIEARLRSHFYDYAVPWLEGGHGRLMPVERFEEFAEKHTQLAHDFDVAVNEFVSKYEDHIDLARERKGELFNEAEYPENIKDKFSVKLLTLPFPDSDFRLDAPQEVIDTLEEECKTALQQVGDTLSREFRRKFNERVEKLHKTLTEGERFRKEVLINLQNIIDLALPLSESLDVTLVWNLNLINNQLKLYDKEQIRNSESIQEELIKTCNEVLSS